MTDPVRPVAPRLLTYDVPGVLRVAAIHCHNDLREHSLSVGPWTENCREHYACRVYLDYCAYLKAAAPVPCVPAAETPRNELRKHSPLEYVIGFCRQVAADGILPSSDWFAQVVELLEPLRATGEGVRDADRDVVLRSNSIDAARSDASTSPSTQTPAPSPSDAPPLAVALDPHRLPHRLLTIAEMEFLLAHTRQLLENEHRHGERVETCDAPSCRKFLEIRARLRGAAAVRVEE